jgi:hypothetical protein
MNDKILHLFVVVDDQNEAHRMEASQQEKKLAENAQKSLVSPNEMNRKIAIQHALSFVLRKRKRAKGPNPLSVKKKKKKLTTIMSPSQLQQPQKTQETQETQKTQETQETQNSDSVVDENKKKKRKRPRYKKKRRIETNSSDNSLQNGSSLSITQTNTIQVQ